MRIRKLTPGRLLAVSYILSILLGAFLLSTDIAVKGDTLSFLDALFTATSAQCVTGLTIVDIGKTFTLFGQLVILFLIQIGGLGIMTFSIYLFLFFKQSISGNERLVIEETLTYQTRTGSFKAMINRIIKMTLMIEGIGALILSLTFVKEMGFLKGIYYAVFHSVSAFCNAGFSLFPDSLSQYRGNISVNLVMSSLIIIGGIGFLVIIEVYEMLLHRQGKGRMKFSLHSKIVLITSALLILFGFVFFWILENDNCMATFSFKEKFLSSFFQSVSSRTAGFSTVNIPLLRAPTLLILIFLMFIGASPGSAGGGVKTTTLALLFLILFNRLKGNSSVNVFKRTISHESISKALSLLVIAIAILTTAVIFLLIFQTTDTAHEMKREFLNYTFESVSAIATVGLSTGTTASLNPEGKIIIIMLMFLGRVGLLTIAYSLTNTKSTAPKYAEENIMVS